MYLVDQSKTLRTNVFAPKNKINPKTSVLHVSCYLLDILVKNSTPQWQLMAQIAHAFATQSYIRCAVHIDPHITVHITVHIAVLANIMFS